MAGKQQRVLVTGSCGWTARAMIEALHDERYEVIGFDLPAAACEENLESLLVEVQRGNVTELSDVEKAVRGADAIVHLAVAIGEQSYASPEIPFAVNVMGTYNVLETARRGGITRVVLMGSAPVHVALRDGQQLDARRDWRSSLGRDHLYDLTKRLQEEIGRDFAETFGMRVIVLRAGHIVDGRANVDAHGRALDQLTYCRGGWVCRYDLARACLRALHFEGSGYDAFHVIGSAAARAYFDVERTEQVLGLTFESRFEEYPS